MPSVFFIIGHPRSGTTAVAKLLDLATNAEIYSEPDPKLCISARHHYEFGIPYAAEFLAKSKGTGIDETLQRGKAYGEKNPLLLHFMKELRANWDCRFVFTCRDGRDTLRSKMDWDAAGHTNYGRYEDGPQYTTTQPEDDFWDYSRLRPLRDDPVFSKWRQMEKFEKFAWGWAKFHDLLFSEVEQLPENAHRMLNMNTATAADVGELYEFLGLKGFDEQAVHDLLFGRVNTSANADGPRERYPHWSDWSPQQRAAFDRYAGSWMQRLGYDAAA